MFARSRSARTAIISALLLFACASLLVHGVLKANALNPAVTTDRTGYLVGESVNISVRGFAPEEPVAVTVTLADGAAVPGGGAADFAGAADGDGAVNATWTLVEGLAGNDLKVTVVGTTSGSFESPFNRIATVGTDKFDYLTGEFAIINGAGFGSGESVVVQVVHSNGLTGGKGHDPINALADADGRISVSWFVDPDDSDGSIFRLTATGSRSHLAATSTFTDPVGTTIDDRGPDDPTSGAQTDLSQMSAVPGGTAVAITWNWDDTAWGGSNTGDACALIDTGIDGLANFAFCARVQGIPAAQSIIALFSCDNSRSDRCSGRQLLAAQTGTGTLTLPSPFLSSSSASVVANSDPFAGNAAHQNNNDCDANLDIPSQPGTGCNVADTVANVTLMRADVGGAAARLINVCSYPSGEPNSNPSDCIKQPLTGSLTIVKSATPNDATTFTFAASAKSAGSVDHWSINGSGSVAAIQYGTDSGGNDPDPESVNFDLDEASLAGWNLQSASCVIQDYAIPGTGTPTATGVDNLQVRAGFETVCTFNNAAQGAIKIVKKTSGGSGTITAADRTFHFDPTGFGPALGFDLTPASGDDSTGASQEFGSLLTSSTYSVTEADRLGWDLGTAACLDGNGAATGTLNGTTLSGIAVVGGKTTTCTFTNTRDLQEISGRIVVRKTTVPSPDPLDSTFAFTTTGTGYTGFSLKNGQQNDTNFALAPGTYSVAETANSLYTTTSSCSSDQAADASTPAAISLQAGETVTCTFTNTRDQGYLKLSKVFDAKASGFAGTFAVVYNCGAGDVTVNLAAGASSTVGPFGTTTSCTVSEPTLPTAPANWTFGTPSVSTPNPVTITKGDPATAVTVTVTNSISHDQGYLKVSKVFDPKASGFAGTFAVVYNCGAGDVTVNLAAGASTTVGPFDTTTSCTVSEPTLPAAPANWTFGTPVVATSPATIAKGNAAAAVAVTVTNSITRDQGYLKLSKVFDAKTSGFSGNFAVIYNCGAGNVTVNLAAGASSTVGPFDTTTNCTVTEPTLPTAPANWTFGTPVIATSPAAITKGDAAGAVTVTVTNSISHDQGYLKLSKVFDAKTSGFAGTFAVVYNCGAGDVTVPLGANTSSTVGPFDATSSCTVSEPTLPSAPTGWTFGAPSISMPNPVTITKGNQAAAATVTVTNSITRDQGFLKVSKAFDPKTSTFSGTFAVVYNCGAGDQTLNLAAGGSTTVGPFNTGTSCAVSESTLPSAPTGWTFGAPSISTPNPVTIAKGDQASAVTVTVTNSITRDQGFLKVTKVFDPKTSGFNGTFAVVYNCGAGDQTLNLAGGGSATVGPFNTGTSCAVSEPTLPTAPTGWTFGLAVVAGTPAMITKGDQAAAVTVTVTNSISRDVGNFKISKTTMNPDGATLPAAFTGTYNCGTGYTGNFSVANGASQMVTGIPTGNTCSVIETAPALIGGYTWGTTTYTPASIAISTKGGTFEVVIGNSITRDRGSLRILKTLSNPDGATVPTSFSVNYNCGTGYAGNVNVAPGSPATVNGIPTGTGCSVTEVAPAAIPLYTWGTITYSPASVVISTKATTFDITVGNSITRDRGTIVVIKNAKPANGSFAFATTGTGYNAFTLTGSTASNGNRNTQVLITGTYTVKESTQLGWVLTGLGGAADPNPYNCVVTGSAGSAGSALNNDPSTLTATITLKKGDIVTCTFENTGNGATRTQGFWATHMALAAIAWNGGTAFGHTFPGVDDKMLCSRLLGINEVMGGFWSDVSKTSTGKKRSALDQSRMQLLQQLLAAELNGSAFGTVPSNGSFAAWESAYCGSNQTTIGNAMQQAAAFNSAGDSSTFTPGTSADSKTGRAAAAAVATFWDILP
jgi:hypothetical protein